MIIHQVINDISVANGSRQKIARLLHAELLARGWPARLVSLVECDPEGLQHCSSFDLPRPHDVRAVLRLAAYIRRHVNQDDIVHAHIFPTNLYASIAARLANWPGKLICTEHSTSNRRRNTLLGRIIDALLYSRHDHIACISQGTEESLTSWMPRLKPKTCVIENGVPLVCREFAVRAATSKPVVVSVGRLSTPKNYDTVLRALVLLEEVDFEYRIAGTGPEEGPLKRLCGDLGLNHKVHFLGFVQDVSSLLSQADVFLMPSRWEGFGLSVVEAMNAGLPVVVSDVAGLREVVGAENAGGVFVDPTDTASIAQGVRTMLEDPFVRTRSGKNGFARSKQFSLDTMVEKYLELYSRLANRRVAA